jgi:hypothetical protein
MKQRKRSAGALLDLREIHAQCEEADECWLWTRGCNSQGLPIARHGGKVISVRRLALALWSGESYENLAGPVVWAKPCMDTQCCNPAHLVHTPQRVLWAHMRSKGLLRKSDAEIERITVGRRIGRGLKLDIQKARFVRQSKEPAAVLAAALEVDKSIIHDIRAGRAWRELAQPVNSVFSLAQALAA